MGPGAYPVGSGLNWPLHLGAQDNRRAELKEITDASKLCRARELEVQIQIRDNGKSNGNYYNGLYRSYIRIMEKT